MSVAYYDGKFVDSATIKISPFDYGFARGMTLFEYTRVYGGKPFRLDDHIRRFMDGAKTMGITLTLSPREISDAVHRLTRENKFAHSGVKFYLTIGECQKAGGYGFCGCTNFTPHLMMIEEEAHPEHPEAPKGTALYQRGVALKTVPFSRQISEAKSINYAAGFIAARELAGSDYDEILYLHPKGFVTETTVSNFFCVIDGVLCTPGNGMLGGVTRIALLEIGQKLGITCKVRDLTPADLRNASEAFISGTFIEMLPVRKIDDITFAKTMDAPVFAQLRKAFSAAIAESNKAAS